MNTRAIQPKSSWSPELGDISIDTLCLKDFFHYFFDGGGGVVSYTLSNSQTGVDYFSGNINVPSSVVQQWGADDDIIWDYVSQTIGVVFV